MTRLDVPSPAPATAADGLAQDTELLSNTLIEVLDPVVGLRRRLEAPEHAVQERGDQLLLGREVVVERHRHGFEPGGDGAHRQRVEALFGHGFGGFEDDVGGEGAAGPAGALDSH